MREEIEIEGVDGICYLIGFSQASESDRENGKLDSCIPLVKLPNYEKPQLINKKRIKTPFVVIDAWRINGSNINKFRVGINSVGFENKQYFFTEHNARMALYNTETKISIKALREKNAFVINGKLYQKQDVWIVSEPNKQNMWIKSNKKDPLLTILNEDSNLDLTLTYKGVPING